MLIRLHDTFLQIQCWWVYMNMVSCDSGALTDVTLLASAGDFASLTQRTIIWCHCVIFAVPMMRNWLCKLLFEPVATVVPASIHKCWRALATCKDEVNSSLDSVPI